MSKMKLDKMTPRRGIRAKCLDCSTDSSKAIEDCWAEDCPLYEHRSGHRPKVQGKTPMKAIRAYCLDCCNGSWHEVKLCPSESCVLHIYRFGKNPAITRPGAGCNLAASRINP
jgi:hypothetical protein